MPAVAVIRRGLALFKITGRKGFVGGLLSVFGQIPRLNRGVAKKTFRLESERREWNVLTRGKIHRSKMEHRSGKGDSLAHD